MADGIPPTASPGMEEPQRPPPANEPPPLDAIRVRGSRAKGLNKPAILLAAGGGVAVVLVLASGAFSPSPARKPNETKPMMSDPARPEMARGAIRDLPADYTQAIVFPPEPAFVPPPQIGPPLPGDMAAFAHPETTLRGRASDATYGWTDDQAGPPPVASAEMDEEDDAERSGIFFALRNEPDQRSRGLPLPGAGIDRDPGPATPAPMGPASASGVVDRSLFPGAVIPASLVTELNSESPGPVIAQVTQAIYDSATGRTLLIPQGARLIGEYKSSTRYGQSRVAIIWSRLIMPDGAERRLDELASSPNGAAGVTGEIDNHWGDVFGAAALGTLVNIGVAATEDPQVTGIGVVIRDPVNAAVADGVQTTASAVTNRVVDRSLAIPPTVRVSSGARISVIVTRRTAF